jgi:hypothetical protein
MPAEPILGLSPYVWVMLIFLVVLIVAFVMGDFADVDHDAGIGEGISPLSLPVLALFGTGFGGVGAILDTLLWPIAAVVGGALIAAALIAGGMYMVMVRVFVRTQASSDVVLPELIGQEANVTIPIGPGRTGQVMVITAARGRTLLSAISTEEIPTDAAVVIEGVAGNSVRVRSVQ